MSQLDFWQKPVPRDGPEPTAMEASVAGRRIETMRDCPGRVLELFAGCGGAALGLSEAGWKHLACVERMAAAAATLRAAGLPTLEMDVREVDWSPFRGEVDLMWASPPCQAGSTAGKRRGAQDDRNGWPWTLDAIDAIRPTWLLAENVLGWTYHRKGCDRSGANAADCVGCYFKAVLLPGLSRQFRHVGLWRVDAADYGTPQHRRRVIIWAGPFPLPDEPPQPTHVDPSELSATDGASGWVTIRDAIGHTILDAEVCAQRRCYPCDGTHGRACKEPWRLDRPAPTVTTTEEKGTRAHAPDWDFNGGPDRASDALFAASGIRRIQVEEALILQGFPKDWPLQGNQHERYLQVGNAVPPPLAQALGRVLADATLWCRDRSA
jgi:DNA (cytosine-5)-methyltransferase 1